ncbi:MAG TPA: DUF4276 family protein [Pyrinomonadaceae bacterium]|nr:DUF4276 family protein [Pyrinomonadaceae bacterium]
MYIEGGATGKTAADSDFRRGWKKFLSELRELAQEHGYHSLEIVRGKGRSNAFNLFVKRKAFRPNDLVVLVVDSEIAVATNTSVWEVVRNSDKWQKPVWATDSHLYLMVHVVETWLLTDQEALKQFFKRGLNLKALPTSNLEDRSKTEIERALKQATKDTQKGSYTHGQAHEIIELVNPDNVKTLTHGKRLFTTLRKLIEDNPASTT